MTSERSSDVECMVMMVTIIFNSDRDNYQSLNTLRTGDAYLRF